MPAQRVHVEKNRLHSSSVDVKLLHVDNRHRYNIYTYTHICAFTIKRVAFSFQRCCEFLRISPWLTAAITIALYIHCTAITRVICAPRNKLCAYLVFNGFIVTATHGALTKWALIRVSLSLSSSSYQNWIKLRGKNISSNVILSGR